MRTLYLKFIIILSIILLIILPNTLFSSRITPTKFDKFRWGKVYTPAQIIKYYTSKGFTNTSISHYTNEIGEWYDWEFKSRYNKNTLEISTVNGKFVYAKYNYKYDSQMSLLRAYTKLLKTYHLRKAIYNDSSSDSGIGTATTKIYKYTNKLYISVTQITLDLGEFFGRSYSLEVEIWYDYKKYFPALYKKINQVKGMNDF